MRDSAPSIEPLTHVAFASEERSGVVQLRAVASREDVADELLGIGVPSALTSPLALGAASGLAPTVAPARGRLLLAASVAFFALGALAMGTAWAMTSTRGARAAAASAPADATAPGNDGRDPSHALSVVVEDAVVEPAPNEPTSPTESAATSSAPVASATASTASPRHAARGQSVRPTPIVASPTSTPATASGAVRPADRWETGDATAPSSGLDSGIDALLDRALGGAPSSSSAAPVGAPVRTLPATPTRTQVLTTLRSLEGEVRECAAGESGLVSSRVVFVGETGRAASAQIAGDFAGTPEGSCMARVLRSAQLPAFSQDRFEVSFPYRL